MLFTPCLSTRTSHLSIRWLSSHYSYYSLVFTSLRRSLNPDKLLELGIIPVIFILQTLVSYVVSIGVSKAFRFNKRALQLRDRYGREY